MDWLWNASLWFLNHSLIQVFLFLLREMKCTTPVLSFSTSSARAGILCWSKLLRGATAFLLFLFSVSPALQFTVQWLVFDIFALIIQYRFAIWWLSFMHAKWLLWTDLFGKTLHKDLTLLRQIHLSKIDFYSIINQHSI